jgi:hypothetical protein
VHRDVPLSHIRALALVLVLLLQEALVLVSLNAERILNTSDPVHAVQASSFEIFANDLNVGNLVVETAKLCRLAHPLLHNDFIEHDDLLFQIPLNVNTL